MAPEVVGMNPSTSPTVAPLGRVRHTPREVNVDVMTQPSGSTTQSSEPIAVALVDDYDVVLLGVARCCTRIGTGW